MNTKMHEVGDLVRFEDTDIFGVIVTVKHRPGRIDGALYDVMFPGGISRRGGYMLWPVEK